MVDCLTVDQDACTRDTEEGGQLMQAKPINDVFLRHIMVRESCRSGIMDVSFEETRRWLSRG